MLLISDPCCSILPLRRMPDVQFTLFDDNPSVVCAWQVRWGFGLRCRAGRACPGRGSAASERASGPAGGPPSCLRARHGRARRGAPREKCVLHVLARDHGTPPAPRRASPPWPRRARTQLPASSARGACRSRKASCCSSASIRRSRRAAWALGAPPRARQRAASARARAGSGAARGDSAVACPISSRGVSD